ncbi:MAG: hypothetical protein ACKOQY_12085 [Bacteroidota bacterium]
MVSHIAELLEKPQELELLYRQDKAGFQREFDRIYPEISIHPVAQAWHARLHYSTTTEATTANHWFLIVTCLLAGFLAKLPDFFPIAEEFYYPRNIGFFVFPFLIATFAWQRDLPVRTLTIMGLLIALVCVWINSLPDSASSDTLILSCIHVPLLLWSVLGFAYASTDTVRRIEFLRYNGELLVMTGIILIAGGLLTAITLGLFELINVNIQEFYFRYIVIWGLASAPLVGTFLVQNQPQLVDKVSPVIARVFSPLVLITLVAYISAVLYTGKDPYTDRDFLIVFNLLLIGVMAIVFFAVAERSGSDSGRFHLIVLAGISIAAILVNGIALSAILFRIGEWGITPNRMAVLGGNILILINLLIVALRLVQTLLYQKPLKAVEESIARFLPVYAVWTCVVVFLFPLLFQFR